MFALERPGAGFVTGRRKEESWNHAASGPWRVWASLPDLGWTAWISYHMRRGLAFSLRGDLRGPTPPSSGTEGLKGKRDSARSTTDLPTGDHPMNQASRLLSTLLFLVLLVAAEAADLPT